MSSQHTYPRPPTATTSIIAPLSPPTRQQTAGLIVVPEHEVMAVAHHAALMRRSAPHESRSRCSRLAAHVGRVCTFRKWSARLPCHALPLLIGVAMTQQLRPSSARAASLRRISRRGRRAEPRRRKCDGRSCFQAHSQPSDPLECAPRSRLRIAALCTAVLISYS